MKIRYNLLKTVLLCSGLLSASGFNGQVFSSPPSVNDAAAPGSVLISGKKILRDGTVWIPHGFYQIAFEVPTGELSKQKPFWGIAAQYYTPQEYIDMQNAGADSVRIQIAQTGMDPQGQYFTREFRDNVVGAIQAARLTGLTVIVSMQDEAQTGQANPAQLPNAATQRAWGEIALLFGQDRGVLFELLNEPHIGTAPEASQEDVLPSAQDWQAWAAAMNTTIQTIRGFGAVNVVVADGLAYAEQLSGAPSLNDPLNQVAYAAHPYAWQENDQNPSVWDSKFGNFSQNHPVIITEWGIGFYCDENTPATTALFFQYLQAHEVGLEIGSWDWSSGGFGSAVWNFPNYQFSSFVSPSACHEAGFGPGATVESWYRNSVPPSKPQ